jgi:hypothetical protein
MLSTSQKEVLKIMPLKLLYSDTYGSSMTVGTYCWLEWADWHRWVHGEKKKTLRIYDERKQDG